MSEDTDSDGDDYEEAMQQLAAHQRPSMSDRLVAFGIETVLTTVQYVLIATAVTTAVLWVAQQYGLL